MLENLCVQTSHWKCKCWLHFSETDSYNKEVWQGKNVNEKVELFENISVDVPKAVIILSEGSIGTSEQPTKLWSK